jgi:hypothetical protein
VLDVLKVTCERFYKKFAFFRFQTVIAQCNSVYRKRIPFHCLSNCHSRLIEELEITIIYMMTLLALLVSDKHAGFGIDLQLLASLQIGKARILDFILFNIVIFKTSLTLI